MGDPIQKQSFSNLAKLFLKLNKKVAMLEEYYIPENCDNANCIC